MSWARYFRRRRWDRERSRELEAKHHIEPDDNLARGMTPHPARAAALRKLGNATSIREEIYHMNTVRFLETLWLDLRYAVRLLRLNPGFAALVAIASLALGIGANAAMFQLLDTLALRPLPVRNAGELAVVNIANRNTSCCVFNTRYSHLTTAVWERPASRSPAGILRHDRLEHLPLQSPSISGELHLAQTLMVDGDFFSLLGVAPTLGRVLTAADDQRGCRYPTP